MFAFEPSINAVFIAQMISDAFLKIEIHFHERWASVVHEQNLLPDRYCLPLS